MFGDDEPEEPSSRSSSSATAGVPARRRRQEAGLRGRAGDGHLVPVPRRAAEQLPADHAAQDRRLLDRRRSRSTNPQGRLAFTDQVEGGQHYQVAVVLQRALFPLAPGKLTVTPMEAEIVARRLLRARDPPATPQVRAAGDRGRRAAPLKGQAGRLLARSNVGRFTLDVAVDRAAVAVGDAVTLTVTVRGVGNVRNVRAAGAADAAGLEELRAEDRRRAGARRRSSPGTKTAGMADPPRASGQDHDPGADARQLRSGRQALRRGAEPADRARGQRRADRARRSARPRRRATPAARRRERHRRGDPADPRARAARRARSARRSCAARASRSRW